MRGLPPQAQAAAYRAETDPSPGSHLSMRSDLSHKGRGEFGESPIERSGSGRQLRPDVFAGLLRRRDAALLGGLVVQLNQHAVGIIDENLPELAAGHLPRIERHA